ncbi:MAG: 50S ribosomal protein L23 [Eubacteriales bacterium]|nr:50S ribosomal protein L23 [Eubacteriales bacterium]
MNPRDIIIEPLITERSAMQAAEGKYTFRVAKNAGKPAIRQACEELFDVKVLKVNTVNVRGKKKRQGYTQGRTASWKKAVVTIDLNPEASTYLEKGGKTTQERKKYKTEIEAFGLSHIA